MKTTDADFIWCIKQFLNNHIDSDLNKNTQQLEYNEHEERIEDLDRETTYLENRISSLEHDIDTLDSHIETRVNEFLANVQINAPPGN